MAGVEQKGGGSERTKWVTVEPNLDDNTVELDLGYKPTKAFYYDATVAGFTLSIVNEPTDSTVKTEITLQVKLSVASHTITLPSSVKEENVDKGSLPLTGVAGTTIKTIQFIRRAGVWEIFYPSESSGGTPDDGSVTDTKLATDVKIGSISALNTIFGLSLTNLQGFFQNLFNRFTNITTANTTQVLVNIAGVITSFAGFVYDSVTNTLTISGDGTSSIIEFDQTATSGNSGLKVTPGVDNSCKRYDNSRIYDYLDTTNGRIVQLQPIRQEIGGSTIIRTGGAMQSTSATPVVLETIAVPTGETITIESTIDAVVAGGNTSTHKKIIGIFKNVAGTVSQIGATSSVMNINDGYGDNAATGIAGFNINGTNIEIRFTGAASVTGDVTSYTITKYK